MVTWEQIVQANTFISTLDIKGKEYAPVNQRLKAFRMVYPTGEIFTEMMRNDNGVCVFRATVGYYDDGRFIRLATGTASEAQNASYINKTSYVENAETSAVGRALGFCGFGIETSICSAEELTNALAQQETQRNTPAPSIRSGLLNAQRNEPPMPNDSPEEAQYRVLCLRKVKLVSLDRACMNHWGTDFRHTPVAQIKTMLPEEILIKMEELKRE